MTISVDVAQPALGEDAGVGGLGDGRLLYLPVLFQQTLEDDAGGLVGEGRHLQVEVTRSQEQWVEGGQLDHHPLTQAEGPALVPKQHIRVCSLPGAERKQVITLLPS